MRYIYIILLSFIIFTSNCFAKTSGEVICGAYPISIFDLDFTHNNFKITYYLWALSKTGYNAGESMEISNATKYRVNFSEMDKVPGFDRSNVRYTATIGIEWDLTYFPFDRQTLVVRMEDVVNEENKVKFTPDVKNSALDPHFSIQGWALKKFEVVTDTHLYNTNFGDESVQNSKFSRLKLIFQIKRHGGILYLGLFIGFFISYFLCLIAYMTLVERVTFRGSLILGAIFSAIGNKYIIEQTIPPNTFVLLFDIFQVVTFFVILYTLFATVISYHMYKSGKARKAIVINKYSALGSAILYIIVVVLFTYVAVVS